MIRLPRMAMLDLTQRVRVHPTRHLCLPKPKLTTAGNIPQTLATLHARLRGLETEGSSARRRVRELEGELDRAKVEVEHARKEGGAQLQEVAGEKSGTLCPFDGHVEQPQLDSCVSWTSHS